MTFRTISRRLTAVAVATAAAAAMSAGAAQSASADIPPIPGPDSVPGHYNCGGCNSPGPNKPKPKPKPKPCGGSTGRSCEPHPGCSGGVCLPPPPPGGSDGSGAPDPLDPLRQEIKRFSDASDRCDAGDADGCDYIATHQLPVIAGSTTGDGGGFVQMFPVQTNVEVDCAKTPQHADCDPDGVWCDDHPEDPDCDPGADAGLANVENVAVDNAAGLDAGADAGAVDEGF